MNIWREEAMREGMRIVAVLLAGTMLTGCATIMNQTTQSVGISSSPTGASVLVDQVPYGKTPVVTRLSRRDDHRVRIELEGYRPFETTLTHHVSGWVWGNVLIGGLIGLAIDSMSGGLYKLTPDQVAAELQRNGQTAHLREDTLYVAVVLTPDPAWERIGQLREDGAEGGTT